MNNNKPDMHCYGKCYLNKELKKDFENIPANNSGEKQMRTLKNYEAHELPGFKDAHLFASINKKINHYSEVSYTFIFTSSIFLPPENIFC
ncbi:MAG: hypothetical protein H7Y00_14400 [Fimbriimonadaceae bacterium]|nr:hypothetical protein [Chitinophagales bacterium]